jgi:hypothetical protein
VLGTEPIRADVLAGAGLDDRSSSGAVLKAAETLMAQAVGADHAFFSPCGSSLSVKARCSPSLAPRQPWPPSMATGSCRRPLLSKARLTYWLRSAAASVGNAQMPDRSTGGRRQNFRRRPRQG